MTNQPYQTLFSPMVDRAIGFAARKHDGQQRKVGAVPYISHPFGVGLILLRMGCREEVVAAGILHDLLEDTNTSVWDICSRFGPEVAEIVAGCTELPTYFNSWEMRKINMIERLRDASLEVKLVSAADKYHNLHHISTTEKKDGAVMWDKFGRGIELQAWYYRAILKSIMYGLTPNHMQYPIFGQLTTVVNNLFKDVPPSVAASNYNLVPVA